MFAKNVTQYLKEDLKATSEYQVGLQDSDRKRTFEDKQIITETTP